MLQKKDLGLFPETIWLTKGGDNPVIFGEKNQKQLKTYSDILDLELIPFETAKSSLRDALKSDDPVERYWAVTVCIYFGKEAVVLKDEIKELLNNDLALVKSKVMLFLSVFFGGGGIKFEKPMLVIIFSANSAVSYTHL
ncbi:MAG: hypothetical protein LUH63_11215, partial [Parabacteroides sp.]|nr:hypothetical protein [Parabacteroides sp.]